MNKDVGIGSDAVSVEKGFWCDKWIFERYAGQKEFEEGKPYDVSVVENGNLLLNVGINRLWELVTGASVVNFTNAATTIGVGDDTTAAAASQTDLIAATNKTYKGMEATYPTAGTAQKLIARSVFESAEANYAWQEFVIKQTVCLNRLVSNQGTKASGQVWTVTLEVTLT